ncbi:MAG: hypothetical protein NTW93_02300 [Phycisphaerae bacterium]|nr:hypothetical protein [Phycisphaerae bacterium]
MDLLKGVGVVIDDGIGEQDNINKIIEKVHEKGIPTTEFKDIDSAEKCVQNLLAVNFIILDWKMDSVSVEAPIGVGAGQELVTNTKQKVIEFIKELKKYCFAPIFIFTNEAQADIESDILAKLRSAGLYFDQEGKDFIYVRNKKEILKYGRLFKEINKWINKMPSIYILKAWDKEFFEARNEIFWDLYNRSQGGWPKVLWDHYKEENEIPYICINELICQIISGKITLRDVDENIIVRYRKKPALKEIKDIFKRVMFQDGELSNYKLEGIKPGDIFKDNGKYYLNIRPECDTVGGRAGARLVYLLEGNRVANTDLKKLKKRQYSFSGLNAKINEAFVWLLEGDGIVKFDFRNIEAKDFSGIEKKRLCRLLPPYITNIQQRYSSFLGRFGVPRLPKTIEVDILKTS